MRRRGFLYYGLASAGSLAVASMGLMGYGLRAARANTLDAFALSSDTDAVGALTGHTRPAVCGYIRLKADPKVAAKRPVAVTVRCELDDVSMVALVTHNNRRPLNCVMRPLAAAPYFRTRIQVERSSKVTAYVVAGGQLYTASADVEVMDDGTGMMVRPIGRRQQLPGSEVSPGLHTELHTNRVAYGTEVLSFVQYTADHGARPGPTAGEAASAHFIDQMVFALNGEPVADVRMGPHMPHDPMLAIALPSAHPADTISVRWTDNDGHHGSATRVLS